MTTFDSFFETGKFSVAAFLCLALAIALCVGSAGQTVTVGNVAGTLYWNGAVVQGSGTGTIYVYIPNQVGNYLSAGGTYAFNDLPTGSYSVNVYGNGCPGSSAYLIGSTTTSITSGTTTTADIDLTSTAGRVQGTVYLNGAPMPNPIISIAGLCGTWQTQSTGAFSHFLPPGTYTANVQNSSGSTLGSFSFTISAGQTTDVGIVNVSSTVVNGQIIWNGAAISGPDITTIYAYISGANAGNYIGSDGSFSISGVASGSYSLNVYGNGCPGQANYQIGSTAINAVGGTITQNVDITTTAGRVIGTITVNGTPLPNPTISISGLCGQWRTNSDGSFMHYLPPGTYTASVSGSAGQVGTFNFTITAGQTTDVGPTNFNVGDLTLSALWYGAPVTGNTVGDLFAGLFSGSNYLSGTYLNGGNGTFSFNTLAVGSYSATIYQNGCPTQSGSDLTGAIPFNITEGTVTQTNVDLSATAGRVSGWAMANGAPLTNPQIAISGLCGTWPVSSNGTFLQYLKPATYTAQVSGQSGPLGTFTFTIVAGQTTRADFTIAGSTPTTTTISSSSNPAAPGDSVTFTVTVTPQSGSASGAVAIYDAGTLLTTAPLISGQASFTTTTLALGTHAISATYSGDTANAPSNSANLSQVIMTAAATNTVLTSSANPSAWGQSVSLSASVTSSSGTPAGTVTFYDGGLALGTGTLSGGVASLSSSALSTGLHSITATYQGNSTYLTSSSAALSQVVNQATTSTVVTSSASPQLSGQPVTLTATITGQYGATLTGSVAFNKGTTVLATVPVAGNQASFTTSFTANTSITAVYSGDTNNLGSTSPSFTQLIVAKWPTSTTMTVSATQAVYHDSVTMVARVTGPVPPTGSVTFRYGTTSVGSATLDSYGVAVLTKNTLPVGNLALSARYSGNTTLAPSVSSTTNITIAAATSTISVVSSLNPSNASDTVELVATVNLSTGLTPTGSVTFSVNGTQLGTAPLSGGRAIFVTNALPAGTDNISVSYPGSSTVLGSTASVLQQVN